VDEKDVVVAERAVELGDVEDEDDLEEDEDDDSGGVTTMIYKLKPNSNVSPPPFLSALNLIPMWC